MTDLRTAAQQALEALETIREADTAGATPKMVVEARKMYEPAITALRAALAEPVQQTVWVCPDSVEHRYRKPGHCEDCNKTLVQVAGPVHEPVAWRYSTMGTWVYVDTDPILWQDKPDGEIQALYLQQTTVCLSEEKNDAMLSQDSTTK